MNWKSKLKSVKGTEFEASRSKPVDPRERFIENVQAQLDLFMKPADQTGNIKQKPTFTRSLNSSRVKFGLKFGNTLIKLDGEETSFVAENGAEFVEILTGVLHEANAGVYDEQLNTVAKSMSDHLANARAQVRQSA